MVLYWRGYIRIDHLLNCICHQTLPIAQLMTKIVLAMPGVVLLDIGSSLCFKATKELIRKS